MTVIYHGIQLKLKLSIFCCYSPRNLNYCDSEVKHEDFELITIFGSITKYIYKFVVDDLRSNNYNPLYISSQIINIYVTLLS